MDERTDKRVRFDRASSIIWFLVGVFFTLKAYKTGLGNFFQPGPGFIFFLAGIFLSLLSVVNFIKTYFIGGEETGIPEKLFSGLKWGRTVLVILALFACVYCFEIFGFILSTFLMLFFLLSIIERVKWWIALLISLITISTIYFVFGLWMEVLFPKGLVGL